MMVGIIARPTEKQKMLHEYLSCFFLILGGLFYAKSHWTLSARKDWIFSFSFLISLDFLGGFYDST